MEFYSSFGFGRASIVVFGGVWELGWGVGWGWGWGVIPDVVRGSDSLGSTRPSIHVAPGTYRHATGTGLSPAQGRGAGHREQIQGRSEPGSGQRDRTQGTDSGTGLSPAQGRGTGHREQIQGQV